MNFISVSIFIICLFFTSFSSCELQCPVVHRGYHELRVAGFKLLEEHEFDLSRRCFKEALHLYLSRVSHFRVLKPMKAFSGNDRNHAQSIQSKFLLQQNPNLSQEDATQIQGFAADIPPHISDLKTSTTSNNALTSVFKDKEKYTKRKKKESSLCNGCFFHDEQDQQDVISEYEKQLSVQRN